MRGALMNTHLRLLAAFLTPFQGWQSAVTHAFSQAAGLGCGSSPLWG